MLTRLIIVVVILSAAPLQGGAAPPSRVTLEINHLWNGQSVAIPGDVEFRRAGGDMLAFTRLSYLLSDPRARKTAFPGAGAKADEPGQAEWLQRGDWFAHVEGADEATRVTLAGLPRGHYSALQFHIGLDEETNSSDPSQYPPDHPLNPVRNNLHWTWQGEYIFLAAEGRIRSAPATEDARSSGQAEGQPNGSELSAGSAAPVDRSSESLGFSYHLGNAHNLMAVTLPVDLDLSTRDARVVVDFHLDRVFDGASPLDVAARTSTHGREGDELAATLVDRIQNAFTIRKTHPISTPGSPRTQTAASEEALPAVGTPFPFKLRRGFPAPGLPTDFPMTYERVALGGKLFRDPLLSRSDTISCATCHESADAFTDARRFSVGEEGREGTRNAMPLFNLAWKDSFFWDGRAPSLREQALIPIEDVNEMHESLEHVEEKLASHAEYPSLFEAAFGKKEITAEKLGIAIEQFVLTLTSFDSKFDRAMANRDTLTDEEKRGFELFFTEYDPRRGHLGADCFHCHGGPFFTDHRFHNNGLAPDGDEGRFAVTGDPSDRSKFSTPSLRNIALTAPYMHDGRFATLEEVLAHYTSGIHRSETLDPNLAKHSGPGVPLSKKDQAAVIAFLKSLTDDQYRAENPRPDDDRALASNKN